MLERSMRLVALPLVLSTLFALTVRVGVASEDRDAQEAFRIVAFGDSTTAPRRVGERDMLEVYANRLAHELPALGFRTHLFNAGVPSDTTERGRARFERDVLSREPDAVIIQFGANDSAIDVHKNRTEPRVAQKTYEDHLRFFITTLQAGGCRVILMTPNPFRWTTKLKEIYGKPPYDANDPLGFNLLLKEYAQSVRKIAEAHGLPLVDVFTAFEEYGGKDGQSVDDLLLDGIHPNRVGHRIVADCLVQELTQWQDEMPKGRGHRPPKTLFIQEGEPTQIVYSGDAWKREEACQVGTGVGNALFAGTGIGEGDFHLVTKLSIERLDGGGAGFVFGSGNAFVFDGADGGLQADGPLFGGRPIPLGDPEAFLREGRPFMFEVVRRRGRLSFLIDGRIAYRLSTTAEELGRIGFAPGKSRLRISHFSLLGATETVRFSERFEDSNDTP